MKPNGAGGQVVIIGAGVAGLCCALRLQERNIPCLILEASDAPGGRVRTDKVDGFLLDRGFQVLLTAYPEAQRLLDYKALQLRTFAPGALVRPGASSIASPIRSGSPGPCRQRCWLRSGAWRTSWRSPACGATS